jgi:periodic tryptophan protein 2
VAAEQDAGADLTPSVPSCDWNRFNIQYVLAVSKQRGMKRTLEPVDTEEDSDASDEDSLHLLRAAGEEEEEEMLI